MIDNSIKSILDNTGCIIVKLQKKAEKNANFVLTRITDNGEGIDPDIIPRLFTKFATKSINGTGLELYICKEFIILHGGKISGTNKEKSKGAIFSFKLPLLN